MRTILILGPAPLLNIESTGNYSQWRIQKFPMGGGGGGGGGLVGTKKIY